MTAPGGPPEGSNGFFADVTNVLGLLVAGFVGALNLFGLRSGELSAILRNAPASATLLAVLMMVALAAALASLFFPQDKKMPTLSAWGLFALSLSVGSFVIASTPVSGVTEGWVSDVSYNVGSALAVAAVFLILCGYKRGVRSGLPWKLVLITISIIVLSTAVLAAGRVETQSQVNATYPQLAADIKVDEGVGELSLRIEASKMKNGDQISFFVQGYPRKPPMEEACGGKGHEGPCVTGLCQDHEDNDPCSHIGTGVINPDALGQAKQTISTSFLARNYQLLVIEATVCEIGKAGGDLSKCDWTKKRAILYLNVADA